MNAQELIASSRVSLAVVAIGCGCMERSPSAPPLARQQPGPPTVLRSGEYRPPVPEAEIVGALDERILRDSPAFSGLVRDSGQEIIYKDEEGTGADRMMTRKLRVKLYELGLLVQRQWPDLRVRVTEAWDEQGEHGPNSIHYEGRAADLTLSDLDSNKLGKLAGFAVDAGFDWVYYERNHVHVSVRR
jgi:hypothetical protein